MRKRNLFALAGLGFLTSTVAWAFPWDIDMVDGVFLKAFGWEMMSPPEGSVSINRYREACEPSCAKPAEKIAKWDRMTPAGQALVNPLTASGPASASDLTTGKKMFQVYCETCHGKDGRNDLDTHKAPVADHDPSAGKNRYPAAPPPLSGDITTTKVRSDGYLFLTIRNGGPLMPSYSFAMSDEEIWSTVTYLRTLPGAAYSGQ